MLKRFLFFGFDNNIDALHYPDGGKHDVKFEADTMEELLAMVPLGNLRYWDEYHWLDLEERRWSTGEEEHEFLATLVGRSVRPQQEPDRYVLPHTEEWAEIERTKPENSGRKIPHSGAFGYQPRWSGIVLPPMAFFMSANFKQEPDLRSEEQKRADYLRSCHIKYTK